MAGGGCRTRKRAQPAPLGFFPLQRMRIRKSTNPGFPSPGLFPSQRFSRSQGLTPSGTVVGLFHPTNAPGVPPEGSEVGSAPLSGLFSRWPCLRSPGRPEGRLGVRCHAVELPPEGFCSGARPGEAGGNALFLSRCPGQTIKPDTRTTLRTGGTCPAPTWLRLGSGYPVLRRGFRTSKHPKALLGSEREAPVEGLLDPEGSVGSPEAPDLNRSSPPQGHGAQPIGAAPVEASLHRIGTGLLTTSDPRAGDQQGPRPAKRQPSSSSQVLSLGALLAKASLHRPCTGLPLAAGPKACGREDQARRKRAVLLLEARHSTLRLPVGGEPPSAAHRAALGCQPEGQRPRGPDQAEQIPVSVGQALSPTLVRGRRTSSSRTLNCS
jgi:hypothetical protein